MIWLRLHPIVTFNPTCHVGRIVFLNIMNYSVIWICRKSRDSSVGIALGYGLDDRGLGFDSRRGLGIFLFTTVSTTALGPTQPPIQWVPGALRSGVKRPGREADHSPQSSAEVKEWVDLYLHSPNTPSWRGAQLKHNFFEFVGLYLFYIQVIYVL
jgi:hypothetical protein